MAAVDIPVPFLPIATTINGVDQVLLVQAGVVKIGAASLLPSGGGSTVLPISFTGSVTGSGNAGATQPPVTLTIAPTTVTPGSYTNTNITVGAYGRITSASNGSGGGGGGSITLTGAVTGSGTGTVSTTLAPSGVGAGSYPYGSFTVNAAGQITAATANAVPVLSVTAGTGISVGGTATAPIITNSGVTSFNSAVGAVTGVSSVGVGSGLSTGGTSANPIISNAGVLTVNGNTGAVTAVGSLNGSTGPLTAYTAILNAGTSVSTTRAAINFISGSNVTLTTVDNSGQNRTDVTIAATGGGGSTTALVPVNGQVIYGGGQFYDQTYLTLHSVTTTSTPGVYAINGAQGTLTFTGDGVSVSGSTFTFSNSWNGGTP